VQRDGQELKLRLDGPSLAITLRDDHRWDRVR
jgi:hypothetical protein